MKGVILFEESQVVIKAFRELGHEFYSCDLKDCSGGHPEWHLEMDALRAMELMDWDFIGMHPMCTALTVTGNRTYAEGKPKHHLRKVAIEFTISLWEKAIKKSKMVYMENPKGVLNTDVRLPKPQMVQPYYFGDTYQKTTCLWLYDLPPLFHSKEDTLFNKKTHVHRGEMVTFKSGVAQPKWYADTPSTNSEENRRIRSKTFPGIANAMAEQWG